MPAMLDLYTVESPLYRWVSSLLLGAVAIGLFIGLKTCRQYYNGSYGSIPVVNGRRFHEFGLSKAKARYKLNAKKILLDGLQQNDKAFFLVTDNLRLLILPNKYANEACKHPDMNMSKAVELDLPCHIPGFEGYRDDYFPDHFGVGVIRNKFGKAFSPSLGPMSTDIATFLKDKWACTSGSQKLYLRDSMLRLITQLTAKLRTGELASNSEWMRICTEFQMQIYIAAGDLARYPKLLQHAIHWSLPSCQKLRADIKQARAIFEPFLEERRRAKRKAVEAGEKPPVYDDLAGWLEEGSRNRKYDETLGQLLNAQASCLGASDLLPTILINIAQDRSLAQQLREEILDVVGTEGLTPESLSRLDLMDSVAKESSRMRLIHSVGLKRYAEKNITLSDGFTIPKGSVTAIAMENMWDEAIYSDALVFHGDRFLRQRLLPGQERDARSTTVGSDYLGFGLGRHACPGRFYAASMMKLVLCHILLKYDIASVNDALFMEELEIRPREEELVL